MIYAMTQFLVNFNHHFFPVILCKPRAKRKCFAGTAFNFVTPYTMSAAQDCVKRSTLPLTL